MKLESINVGKACSALRFGEGRVHEQRHARHGKFRDPCGIGSEIHVALGSGPGIEAKKISAGICAILVGWLGVHKFVLGYTTEGIIQLCIGIVTCGTSSIISIIEGIIYLTKSDEEFVRTYIQNKKGWF